MDEDHYLLTNFDYPYTSTTYIGFDYDLKGVILRINGADIGAEIIIHNGNSYTVKVTYRVVKKNNMYTDTATIPANSDFATGILDSGGTDPGQAGSENIGEISIVSVTRV